MTKDIERLIKSFGMTNQMLLFDLKRIEKEYGLENLIAEAKSEQTEEKLYLQFNSQIRAEACDMAKHYQLFYCLEKSIREMISDVLESNYGKDWWEKDEVIPELIKSDVAKNIKKELDSAITPRSSEMLDYTTFGQLVEIIKSNWDVFGSVFNSIRAVERVLGNLNTLRSPIAHCSPLAEIEVQRLHLSLKDWFRLLGAN